MCTHFCCNIVSQNLLWSVNPVAFTDCKMDVSLEGRRWEEQAGATVTYEEMVAFLSDQDMDEQQLKAHWASLTISTEVPTPPMPPTDLDISQMHPPSTPTDSTPPSLTEQIDVTTGAELPAPTTPHARVGNPPLIVAQSPLKRKRVPVIIEGQGSNGKRPYNFDTSSKLPADILFADSWAPRNIYENMCGYHTTTCMLVAWQSNVVESSWGGKLTGKVEIHAFGLDADNSWVRISAYEREARQFHTFVSLMKEGFGYVEFSGLASQRSFKRSHDGCICLKVVQGCNFRRLESSPMWTREPMPTFVEDLKQFCGMSDGRICFVTAIVEERSELRRMGDKASESIRITLRDQFQQSRMCTVFAPLCFSPIWQTGVELDIFGCTCNKEYETFKMSADSWAVRSQQQ